MIKSALKLPAVSFLGLFGDPTYLWRIGACLLVGAGLVVVTYLSWPGLLPIWPGAVTLLGAAAIGILWEWLGSNSKEARLK